MGAGRPLKVAGAVVGVCVLGAGAWYVLDGSNAGESEVAASAIQVQQDTSSVQEQVSGSYQVAYGVGASGTSTSGVAIGYGQDCASAVSAAATYAVAVLTPTLTPAGWTTQEYTDLVAELTGQVQTTASQASTAHLLEVFAAAPAVASAVQDATVYPTDSLFRVTSCTPGSAAQIDLALVTGGTTNAVAFGGVIPVEVELVWSDDDWQLGTLDPFASWESWQAMTTAPGTGWTPPAAAAGRAAIAAAGGAGWTEFTNAGA